MMCRINLLLLSVLVSLLSCGQCRKLPSFIEVCHRNDLNINDCMIKNIRKIQTLGGKEILQLGIPSFNPLVVPKFTFIDTGNFKYSGKNIKNYHYFDFELEKFDFDFANGKINFTLFAPSVSYAFQYKLEGKILLLEINSEGPTNGTYFNLRVNTEIQLEKIVRNKKVCLRIAKNTNILELDNWEFYFDKVFGENEMLNEQFNRYINERTPEARKVIQPGASKYFSYLVQMMFNSVLSRYTLDELFPE